MKIYFYPEANFNINNARIHEVKDIVEFFDFNHLNPDEFYICGKDGKNHPYPYNSDVVAVYPKIGKGGGKNIFTAVLGIFLTVVTGGAAAAISGFLGVGVSTVHLLGMGLLCYGAGSYVMGNMKMPSISDVADSATKQSFQWNVGSLSTSRGVKGITFGEDVVPQGELLSYRTYGSSTITGRTSRTKYYYGNKEISEKQYKANKTADRNSTFNYLSRAETTYTDAYANNDGTSWLEMLIGCGEGELDSITDIKVNDTPIINIADAEYQTRLGSNNQTSLPNTDIDNQIGLMSISQLMPQKLAGADNPLVVTTSQACDYALIACQCSAIYNMDIQSGTKNRCFLKPKIGYRLSGSSDNYTYVNTGVTEFDNDLPFKAESAFYFNVGLKFPQNGVYEISLQNCSAEKCVSKGLLGSLPTVLPDHLQCNITVDNIALYDNKAQTYPGTALIYLRLPASQALSGSIPKVTWKQTRANGYVWNGSRYITKPLNNLAWAIYDILAQVRKDNYTNQYHNEGENVANIDFNKFADFADFCESLNIKGNWFLNKLDSAWSTAMSLATSARCFLGFRQGKVVPFWDAPQDMSQIFTIGSYRDMSGSVTSKKDRGRAIEATFNDENDGFKSKTIRVEVDDFSADAEAAAITFCGLSTVEAVHKAAHYMLRRNKYLCQTVKFIASIRALICEVGDVIGIQCDVTKYGVGGLIYDVINNGAKITLSEPVTLTSGINYALLVAHEDGTLERNVPVETSGTFTQLTFNSSWNATPKKGEQFTFGVKNEEVRKYRVTSITKTSELECEIEAIEYVPALYNEGVAPDISYTNPNAGISSIDVTENPEGVTIAWNPNPNTQYVDVYVDGNYYGRFEEGSAAIPSINSTQHIELIPFNYSGQSGTSIERTIASEIPQPPTPPMPEIQYVAAGYILTFRNLSLNSHLSHIVIYENGTIIAREFINGDTCVVNVALTGGVHYVEACLVNTYSRESTQRSIVLAPPQIAGWIIEYDQISSTNMQIKAEGSIQTADFVSGHNGWCLDKYGKAEFQDATIRGTMTSVNFEKDTVSAVGGSLMILGSAEVQEFVKTTQNTQNILCEDFIDLVTEDGSTLAMEQSGTSVYYEIILDDASTFGNGDILRIRNAETVQDLWLGQVSKSSNTLSCVMLYGSAMDLESGMCIVDYRKAGNGGILLNGNVPLMDMFTHSGRPWEDTDCWVRMGNIKGINGITDDRFGIFIGDSNSSHSGRHFMLYDAKSGKLQVQGEVLITSGNTYDSIVNALNIANSASTTASNAQSTANSANTSVNSIGAALGGNNYPKLTYLSSAGIYTGTLVASQIISGYLSSDLIEGGSINSDKLSANALKSRNYISTTQTDAGLAFTNKNNGGSFFNLSKGTLTSPFFRIGVDSNNRYSCAIGNFNIDDHGGLQSFKTNEVYPSIEIGNTANMDNGVRLDYLTITQLKKIDSSNYAFTDLSGGNLVLDYKGSEIAISPSNSSYSYPVISFSPAAKSKYLISTNASISAFIEDRCDESIKAGKRQVSTLNKLKRIRVMQYHYNDDEILKRQNKEIDCKNKEIEAHNQEVDRKNKEIDIYNKENRANKPKLPRKPLIKKRTLDKSIRNDKSICVFAEEFNKTFGLHNNSTESVALRDLSGVALRSIQELAEQLDDLKRQFRKFKREILEVKQCPNG